ncbi:MULTISPECIES: LysE family translocator [Paenibacillus]|uniref:LysE family translocator n=1 Tax=Paenibacillus TaxID=44249 RepID=UPI0022B8A0B9|nr:LysE family translocator [Paenibacillus caseinilyticus]MCZ8523874.1 LysE family translocator [Paenibacillus caseinilyticus]
MDPGYLISFTAVAVLLTLAPGPDLLFVIAQSLANGRRAGIATGLGLSTGVVAHTFAAALGLSALLYNSVVLFQLVKIAGAAYLLYLAWMAWREGTQASGLARPPVQPAWALFRRGILMNVLNPKVSLFFLALLPQFVTPGGGQPAMQMLVLGALFLVQAMVIFTLVALCSGWLARKLTGGSGMPPWIHKAKAILYAALGLRLVFSQR